MVKYTIYEGGHIEVNKDDPDYKKKLAVQDIRNIFHGLINTTDKPFISEEDYKKNLGVISILSNALNILSPEVEIEIIKKK